MLPPGLYTRIPALPYRGCATCGSKGRIQGIYVLFLDQGLVFPNILFMNIAALKGCFISRATVDLRKDRIGRMRYEKFSVEPRPLHGQLLPSYEALPQNSSEFLLHWVWRQGFNSLRIENKAMTTRRWPYFRWCVLNNASSSILTQLRFK